MPLNRRQLIALWLKVKEHVLDTLFPLRCLGCQTKGTWLCSICQGQLIPRLEQRCPQCQRHITPTGEICFACRDSVNPALDGIFVASSYRLPLLAHLLHTFKYRFIPDLAQPLGGFLAQALLQNSLTLPDTIIPVPLHSRRLRFRGFNQSELLAREISETLTPGLSLPLLCDTLLRTRFTKPQMKTTSREERLANLKNAFALAEGKATTIKGKYLWLIDDVAATGTTLEECATVLKRHGAKTVFGIVVAR